MAVKLNKTQVKLLGSADRGRVCVCSWRRGRSSSGLRDMAEASKLVDAGYLERVSIDRSWDVPYGGHKMTFCVEAIFAVTPAGQRVADALASGS